MPGAPRPPCAGKLGFEKSDVPSRGMGHNNASFKHGFNIAAHRSEGRSTHKRRRVNAMHVDIADRRVRGPHERGDPGFRSPAPHPLHAQLDDAVFAWVEAGHL
jgi:hypothetical protein